MFIRYPYTMLFMVVPVARLLMNCNTIILTVTAMLYSWNTMMYIKRTICPLLSTKCTNVILGYLDIFLPIVLVRILHMGQLLLDQQVFMLPDLLPSPSSPPFRHNAPQFSSNLVGFLMNTRHKALLLSKNVLLGTQ